ncbi:hypothetical protein [Halomonas sp. 18071143]|uniref:hypothetical protein n=1 Tax=Halomonas sp. 18071143 TaxID=2855441 RepID=UPI001C49761D|nr:hypothetical protein [Halomonas sp. 18071143]
MIIINSGAYVVPELQAEYGKLPPVMLPLGNRLLLSHQLESLNRSFPSEKVVLSLPESFLQDEIAKSYLNTLSLNVVAVPEEFSLAESVLYVINTVEGSMPENVRLLHGDTLFTTLPQDLDIVAVASTDENYGWEFEGHENGSELVWCGFFAFENSRSLVRALASAKGSFVNAVRSYFSPNTIRFHFADDWLDLGHVNTYFKSRAKLTTQRSFNSLSIESGVVRKTGSPPVKIQAEAEWYRSLPSHLKKFTPQLLQASNGSATFYELEYLPYLPLNELFVHGRNPVFFWHKILKILKVLFSDFSGGNAQNFECIENDMRSLYVDKTYQRLQRIQDEGYFDINADNMYGGSNLPSLLKISKECIEKLSANSNSLYGVLHGDLCFSNIMYDSRLDIIKVIDPRGIAKDNEFTIYGDQRYDVAKLAHSIIGLYDHIISGQYFLCECPDSGCHIEFILDDRLTQVQDLFYNFEFFEGVSIKSIMPLVVLLFVTMIPLHSDREDRQKAMRANALRLYKDYVRFQ